MNNDNLLKYVIQHAEECYPEEACGYIVNDKNGITKYIPCKNVAEDRENNFFIAPYETIEVSFEYSEPIMVVHSHTDECSSPSDNDLEGCNTGRAPWFIISYPNVEDSTVIFPKGRNTMLDRNYIYGILDCFSLCRDFYKLYGIYLPNYYREEDFWNHGYSQYLDLYDRHNFTRINNLQDAKFGDMILHNIRSDQPNHASIYVGDGQILHQPQSRLSVLEEMREFWQKTFFCILRHQDMSNDNSKLTRALAR